MGLAEYKVRELQVQSTFKSTEEGFCSAKAEGGVGGIVLSPLFKTK